jgi:hypothetical protein
LKIDFHPALLTNMLIDYIIRGHITAKTATLQQQHYKKEQQRPQPQEQEHQ